mgnify:CR=1 FL=1
MANFQDVNEVKTIREANKGIVFNEVNMSAALEALKATPLTNTRTATPHAPREKSQFNKNLEAVIAAIKESGVDTVSMAQIRAMMATSVVIEGDDALKAFNKRISDSVWMLSDKNKKNQNPVLLGAGTGLYKIVK